MTRDDIYVELAELRLRLTRERDVLTPQERRRIQRRIKRLLQLKDAPGPRDKTTNGKTGGLTEKQKHELEMRRAFRALLDLLTKHSENW